MRKCLLCNEKALLNYALCASHIDLSSRIKSSGRNYCPTHDIIYPESMGKCPECKIEFPKLKKKLPRGYELKMMPNINHYWVDGACGYCVASGDTATQAIEAALSRIKEAEAAGERPAWYAV